MLTVRVIRESIGPWAAHRVRVFTPRRAMQVAMKSAQVTIAIAMMTKADSAPKASELACRTSLRSVAIARVPTIIIMVAINPVRVAISPVSNKAIVRATIRMVTRCRVATSLVKAVISLARVATSLVRVAISLVRVAISLVKVAISLVRVATASPVRVAISSARVAISLVKAAIVSVQPTMIPMLSTA